MQQVMKVYNPFADFFTPKNKGRFWVRAAIPFRQNLSPLKLSIYVGSHIKEILAIPDKLLKEIILLHCCYDKHSDRFNMTEMYQQYEN